MRSQKHNESSARGDDKCSGDVKEEENRCVTGVWTVNGEAVVGWAQSMYFPSRLEAERGNGVMRWDES